MMANVNILSTVKHYQKSIEDNSGNPERLLHCIKKLSRLPINITHLSETGIGKTVNSLRKYEGKLGTYANELVLIWKQMVLAEGNISSNSSAKANSADRHKEDCDSDKSPEVENMDGNVKYENKYKSSENKSLDEKQKSKSKYHKDKNEIKNENHGSKQKLHIEHQGNNLERSQDSSKSDTDRKYKEKSRSKHDKDHKNGKHSRSDRDENLSQKERNTAKGEKKEIEKEKEIKKEKHKEKNPIKEQEKDREKRKEQKDRHKEQENRSDKYKKEEPKYGKTSDKNDKEKERDSSSKKRKIDGHDTRHNNGKADSTSPSKSHNENKTKEDNYKRKEKRSSEEKNNDSSSSSSKNSKELKRNRESKNENDELNKSSSKKRKRDRNNVSENEEEVDGIDSSMGANFADVLGMLNMPSKKSKKSFPKLSNSESTSTSNIPKIKESVSKPLPSTSSGSIINKNFEKPSTSSISNLTSKKPELLTSSVKLEPLDPSIVLDLPTISNNYKPLPLNQTVMSCVYNTPQVSTRPAMRLMSDSEALSHSIQSKTVRTKVYSGVKTGQCFQPIGLFELCVRLLQKNIDALEYTGGVPYEVLSSVLKKASPDQLFRFEEYNPYIIEDTDELWQSHVQHNYRSHKRQEMESWREMYLRCREEQERRLNSLTESIKLSTKKLVAPVRKTQLAFVDTLVKPPRNVQRKQEIFGTKAKAVATPAARVAALQQVTPNAAKIGDTRLRVVQSVRDNAQVAARGGRPKKAPLMQKTLQLMRGRNKR